MGNEERWEGEEMERGEKEMASNWFKSIATVKSNSSPAGRKYYEAICIVLLRRPGPASGPLRPIGKLLL